MNRASDKGKADGSRNGNGGAGSDGVILAINSGSSSLKFGVFQRRDGDEQLLMEGNAENIGKPNGSVRIKSTDRGIDVHRDHAMASQGDALALLAEALHTHLDLAPEAVGHRVVHGGPELRDHQRVTPRVMEQLRAATHFAPLHIPQSLSLIEQAQGIFNQAPHFICFDNAFHRTMPERATHLGLPRRYTDAGVIRYGFHGLSYASLVHSLGSELPERAVFAHLGSGSSLCALRAGESIDTSMGMTPTGGVPMGTRSGDLDPGVLLYLMRVQGMDADALEKLLNHDCGMAGIADGESDMRALLSLRDSGNAHARLAVEVYTTAVRKTIGAYAALLGGLDLLVFTGGVGEHSEEVRRLVSEHLPFAGLTVKAMKTEEEKQIARHCRTLMSVGTSS
jgi:acetate kinase